MKWGRCWMDDRLRFPIVAISAAITDTAAGASWTDGFIWIRAGAIAVGAPDDRWHGLLIARGSLQSSPPPVITNDGTWAGVDSALLELAPLRARARVPARFTELPDYAPTSLTLQFAAGRLTSFKTTGLAYGFFSNFYDFDFFD